MLIKHNAIQPFRTITKNYTTEEVEAIFESDSANSVGIKLYAVIQLNRGYSSRKLEEFYRVSHKQICTWADRFDAQGVDGLRIKPGRGRHSRPTKEQKYQIQSDLRNNPEAFGYNIANWSGPLLCEHINERYGIEYQRANVYNLMHKLGFSFQRARGFYPERDEAKRQSAREEIKKK